MTVPPVNLGPIQIRFGDNATILPTLEKDSVDAVVTDPPAGIRFMNRAWDADKGGRREWVHWLTGVMRECHRALKPGGHALVWAIPRTSHWTAWALEDAGFEIRDCITHLNGSGFPKSLDVGKAIDKATGAERPVIGVAADFACDGSARRTDGTHTTPHIHQGGHGYNDRWSAPVTQPGSPDAARWDGWGTALKPAAEHWWLARKPFTGTVAANVLEHGTGALNITECRTAGTVRTRTQYPSVNSGKIYGADQRSNRQFSPNDAGRWPTNAVFSHLPGCGPGNSTPCVEGCPVAELDGQSGITISKRTDITNKSGRIFGGGDGLPSITGEYGHDDAGGASRFFPAFRYEAKASSSERPKVDGVIHETVKPLALMRWLVRLITTPGGTVLDPFLGSGTTAEACLIEGFKCIGIEQDQRYRPLIEARLNKPTQPVMEFGGHTEAHPDTQAQEQDQMFDPTWPHHDGQDAS